MGAEGGADAAGGRGGFVIRRATPDDLDVIVAFNAALAIESEGRSLDEPTLRRGVARLLREPSRGFYTLAEEPGVPGPIAQVMITYEWSDWRDGDIWWIQSVYVAPSHRRRGAYAALHHELERQARAAGARALRLYVERTNAAARATYAALGMSSSHYDLMEQDIG